MKSVLQAKYLWLVVTGTEACPARPTDPSPETAPSDDDRTKLHEYLDWVTRDGAAQGLMRSATDETQWPHVTSCETSKDMWDVWKQIHQTNQQSINIHYFFEELYTRKYIDGTPMADHIAAILDIRDRIIQAGEAIPDLHIVRAMILSLPKTSSWEMIKIQLFDIKVLTSDIVSTKLQTEANRHIREKPGGGQTALQASTKPKKGDGRGDGQNRRANAVAAHNPTTCVGNAMELGIGGISVQTHKSMTVKQRGGTHMGRPPRTQRRAISWISCHEPLGPSTWLCNLILPSR
jgi:hypothetical protein